MKHLTTAGQGEEEAAADGRAPAVVDDVCRSLLRLVTDLPGPPPSRIALSLDPLELVIEWPPAEAPAPRPGARPEDGDAEDDRDHLVRAANVGTFYRRPDPSAAPFAEVGDQVEEGAQVAIVEAMKLMIPVEAPVAGTVTAVHAEDGTPVEYDQPLLSIRPAP
jgi:acetyl-CoA carboxylase biotin carboxyl carrier protein